MHLVATERDAAFDSSSQSLLRTWMCATCITPLNLGKCGPAVLVQLWTAVIFLDQYTGVVCQPALEPGLDP